MVDKLDELRVPGVLFTVGGEKFLTRGGSNRDRIPVIRLWKPEPESLDSHRLCEDIEDDNIEHLGTYKKGSEVVLSEETAKAALEALEYSSKDDDGSGDGRLLGARDEIRRKLQEEQY